MLLAIASVAHGLKVAYVVVWFTVARGNDVVYCPVSAVEMFSARSADRFKHSLGIGSGFTPLGCVVPLRHVAYLARS